MRIRDPFDSFRGIRSPFGYRRASAPPAPTYDPVAELFGAGEVGTLITAADSDLFKDAAGTDPVIQGVDDQIVRRANDLTPNGIDWVQTDIAKALRYHTDGTYEWFEFDAADDGLDAPLNINGKTWDVVASYSPAARNFILLSLTDEANPWIGIGQNGNTGEIKSGSPGVALTQNALYFDKTLSSATTRDGQYHLAQVANVMHLNFSDSSTLGWNSVRLGQYNTEQPFTTPGPIYAFMIREGTMTSTQQANLAQWMAAKQGITL